MFKSSNRFSLFLIICLTLIFVQSCEKDFTSLDSDVITSDNAINFETSSIEYPIVTHSRSVEPVQTNNLPSFLLGYNNHTIFGIFCIFRF